LIVILASYQIRSDLFLSRDRFCEPDFDLTSQHFDVLGCNNKILSYWCCKRLQVFCFYCRFNFILFHMCRWL